MSVDTLRELAVAEAAAEEPEPEPEPEPELELTLEERIASRQQAELDAWTHELKRVAFLERGSAVPQYVYLRWKEVESKRELAEVERKEKEKLLRRKDANAAEWEARGRELVIQSVVRQRQTKRAQRQLQRRKEAQAQAVLEEEAAWEEERERRQLQHEAEMRARVLEGKAAQVRMTVSEEADAERLRKEGVRHRAQIARAAARVKQNISKAKQKTAAQIRADLAEHATDVSEQIAGLRTTKAQEKRVDAQQWKSTRERRDGEYLERARLNRQRALETRANAKKAVAESLHTRKVGAAKERENDYLVACTRARILSENRKEVAAIYRRRFATPRSAGEWEHSPLKRLNSAAAWLTGRHGGGETALQVTL